MTRRVGRRVGRPIVRRRMTTRRLRRPLYERNTRFANPPGRLRTTLSSVANIAVAPGATTTNLTYCLGSGSDPFMTNSDIQPKGWDRLCALYRYYIIDSAAAYITFTNETANPVDICAYIDDQYTPPASDYSEARNMEGARELICSEAGGSKTMGRMKMFGSLRRVLHGSPNDVDNWMGCTPVGAITDPGDTGLGTTFYLHLSIRSLKSSNPANITGMLYLRFFQRARFHSPADINTDTTTS